MRGRSIRIDTEVEVSLDTLLDELDYDDVYNWIKSLASKEKAEFAEGLPECFEDIPASDLLGTDLALDEALEVIAKAYHASPYDRDKIVDRLHESKII